MGRDEWLWERIFFSPFYLCCWAALTVLLSSTNCAAEHHYLCCWEAVGNNYLELCLLLHWKGLLFIASASWLYKEPKGTPRGHQELLKPTWVLCSQWSFLTLKTLDKEKKGQSGLKVLRLVEQCRLMLHKTGESVRTFSAPGAWLLENFNLFLLSERSRAQIFAQKWLIWWWKYDLHWVSDWDTNVRNVILPLC